VPNSKKGEEKGLRTLDSALKIQATQEPQSRARGETKASDYFPERTAKLPANMDKRRLQ